MNVLNKEFAEVYRAALIATLSKNTDIHRLESALLETTFLDVPSCLTALRAFTQNPSTAAAKLAHRVFTVFEATLLTRSGLPNGPHMEKLRTRKLELIQEGGVPTDRLSKLSGFVDRAREEVFTSGQEPAKTLDGKTREQFGALCDDMNVFVKRDGVDRVLFTNNAHELVKTNQTLRPFAVDLAADVVTSWRDVVQAPSGQPIDLGAMTANLGKLLAQ